MTLTQEQIQEIKTIAETKLVSDNEDFCANDYSGGNFDDAYYMGTTDGEILMARNVLDMLNIEYTPKP